MNPLRDPSQPLPANILRAMHRPATLSKSLTSDAGDMPKMKWSLTISGQVRGGKNNMIVTRSGMHFPKAAWAKWRDAAVREVKGQLPNGWKIISEPVNVRLHYVAGDRRRRDFPAICDAVWHVLEKAGVVSDDTYLWPAVSVREYEKSSPSITISYP